MLFAFAANPFFFSYLQPFQAHHNFSNSPS